VLLAGTTLIGAVGTVGIAGSNASAAPSNATKTAAPKVRMTVLDVSPHTPTITTAKTKPLTITLQLVNTTSRALPITVTGTRAAPLYTAAELRSAMAKAPSAPDSSALPIPTAAPVVVKSLAAGASTTVSYTTATSTAPPSDTNFCLCTAGGVYPLYFSATSGDAPVGAAETFVPAFYQPPSSVAVSWVWPLLERPHRSSDDTAFIDDGLAGSVSGGRLDRALATLEKLVALNPEAKVTVVIDPELLDELLVMATNKYTVQTGSAKPVAGTGSNAATTWLGRLRTLLDTDAGIQLALTPYADPDVEALTAAGLDWDPSPYGAGDSISRVTTWLGARERITTLAWPSAPAISAATAKTVASSGASILLLPSSGVKRNAITATGAPLTLRTGDGNQALLTSPKDLDATVARGIRPDPDPTATQTLIAQLGIKLACPLGDPARCPTTEQQVVLMPDRYVDPDPDAAASLMAASTTAYGTAGTTLATAAATVPARSVTTSVLTHPKPMSTDLPETLVDAAEQMTDAKKSLATLFGPQQVVPFLTALPNGIQRAESAGWATDRTGAERLAAQLVASVTTLESGVFIANKPRGSYTLGSHHSRLPVTLENDLDYAVNVVVNVSTIQGLPGLQATPVTATIQPRSKVTVHVPTTVKRSGRIQVTAQLATPYGSELGGPVPLTVRSTALGTIGLVITIVSGGVLVLALLRRFWVRYRRRRRRPAPAPVDDLTPERVP
jgi:hypothetical protein